jgi:hypothetical protein
MRCQQHLFQTTLIKELIRMRWLESVQWNVTYIRIWDGWPVFYNDRTLSMQSNHMTLLGDHSRLKYNVSHRYQNQQHLFQTTLIKELIRMRWLESVQWNVTYIRIWDG